MKLALDLARSVLADRRAWVVGGAPRDRLLARHTDDLDLVLEGDVAPAARALGRAAGAACFELSPEFGAWRVVGEGWQIDVNPLRGGSLGADLTLRDFTVNAIAEPLAGGEPVDPLGGREDLAAGRLRSTTARALDDDPVRVLRLARLEIELGLAADRETEAQARRAAPALAAVAGERVFAELRRLLACDRVGATLRRMHDLEITPAILPELDALRDVTQNRYHHLDVYGHTIEVLEAVVALQRDAGSLFAPADARDIGQLLDEPLADQLTRGTALRLGALFHDVAKPVTRVALPDGRVSFIGHDTQGAQLAGTALARLRVSARLRAHVAALARHHLRLGFLVHQQPVGRRAIFDYLHACQPVEVDVTLLSVADRLATRGYGADEAIARHLEVARSLIGPALAWHRQGAPRPLLRGDELARALGQAPGRALGGLLEDLSAAQYAGEVGDRAQALAYVRARSRAAPA